MQSVPYRCASAPHRWRNESSQKPRLNFTGDVSQPEIAPLRAINKLLMIDPQTVQHRRVEIVHVQAVLQQVIGKIIRLSQHHAALDPAAGHPDREAARMMIAAETVGGDRALRISRSPEFAA